MLLIEKKITLSNEVDHHFIVKDILLKYLLETSWVIL